MARTPIHPGEILADELEDTGLSSKKLAGQYFGMAADFWMNLQSAYELDLAQQENGKAIQRIPKRSDVTAVPHPAV